MKSIFTKLGTLLLCGVVAMVSCTDFSEDIKGLDNKITGIDSETQTELASLQKAITDLEAKLSAQYATKDEVAALKTTLENSIASEVAALSEDIAEVSAALSTAKNEINTAIAGLDDKKADKTAVEAAVKTATDAIAALQTELEAAKGDLEAEIAAVKKQIADTQEALQEQINGVDAKANELQNTLLSLGEYLKTLEAKVNEINNTLISLGEYLPTIEAKILEVKGTVESLGAEYEANKDVVDAKLSELFSTLVSLSNHLEEYEKATDFKLVELQGSLAALSTYLEEYEASVDNKFNEILNTFESLSLFLDEKFAALEATDTDLYKEIEGIRVVLSALNNLLTDETAARESEDAALYELIGSSVTALNNLIADLASEDEALYAELDGVRQAFTALNNLLADESATREAEDAAIYELIGSSVTALNNLIADLEAADEAIYAEIENVRTYVAQVYNALSTEIAATDAALKAHIAAFEAFKAVYEAKVAELEATDEDLYLEINGLREVITTVNNHIEDLRAEDEAIYLEINGLRENLTQLQNAIDNRIDEEVKALKADILEKFNILNTVILETEKRVNDKFNHTLKLIAANTEAIAENAAAIADLEAAVEILKDWIAGQEETNSQYAQLIAGVYEIVGEIEEQIAALMEKDGELEGLIGKTALALQTYMDENDARLADLEIYINENFNQFGSAIRSLEAIINDLQAEFGARLDALEERMDAAEEKIADLEEQAAAMSEAIESIEAAIADLEEMDAALAAEIANVDAAAKKALKEARKELQDQIDALVEAKEDLQVRVSVLEDLVAANEDSIEANRAEIEANVKAISNVAAQLGKLEGTVMAMMQANAAVNSALQQKDADLEASIKAAVDALAGAVSRITAVEQSIEAIYALAETLATKEQLDNATADLTKKIQNEIAILQGQLVAYISQNGANIAEIKTNIQQVNALIDSLEERMDAAEGAIADLEEQTAALEELLAELQYDLRVKADELYNAIKQNSGNIANNAQEIADLKKDIEEIDEVIEDIQKQIADNKTAMEKGDKANADAIADNAEAILDIVADLAELEARFNERMSHYDAFENNTSDKIKELQKQMREVNEKLVTIFGEIDLLKDAVAALQDLAAQTAALANSNKEDIENLQHDLRVQVDQLYTAIKQLALNASNNATAIAELKKAVKEANDFLQEQITDLVNRVQSIVFVPKTSDNFAYIHAAVIFAENRNAETNNKHAVGYLPRISTIKYKVNAKDAAAVAKAIADNYKTVLDYDVIDVTTRGAAVSGADLEIVNVTNSGQYIFVEVMAKNFSVEGFFADRDDDDGIYSAALVLGDGQNYRSTEYTNLVADVDDAYEFHIGYIDAEGMPTFAYDALHTQTYIPCNDNVTVHTAKAPEAFFKRVADGTFLTEAEFASYGYGYLASVEKLSVVTEHDPLLDAPGILSGTYEDFPGNGIWESTLEYFHIAENPDFDYNINVKDLGENPWKYKGNYIKVAYEYTVAGVTVDATHEYILANALIYVNVGAEINEDEFSTVVPWTVALEEAGYDAATETLNAKNIRFKDIKWHGIDDLEAVLVSLIDYKDPRTSFKHRAIGATDWTILPSKKESKFFKFDNYDTENCEVDIVMQGGKYSWNNEYEITYASNNNTLNITTITTINVKLVGKPEKIDVPVTTTFEAVKGQKWFAGQVDLSAAAYAKFFNVVDENNAIDYLGYGESNATKWAALYETWRTAYTAKTYGEPVVNGKTGARRNLWALLDNTYSPIASEARLYSDDNIIYSRPGALTTVNPNKITLTVTPWFGVPVNFTVAGEVALPANKLIFSDEHVQVLANGTGRAEAVGQIGTDGKYSIILSDLAKYFNVSEELKTNMKVVFEVTDPKIAAQVKIADATETPVIKKTTGTYNFLKEGEAVLDWNTFEGTEVPVKATLISEDFAELGSLNLVVWTKDPLTLKGAEGTVNNEGVIVYEVARYPRKDAVAPVFKNLVATSVVEGNTNLIDANALTITDAFKQSQAIEKYGAELKISMGPRGVYYYDDNNKLITLDKNKYTWNDKTGVLVLLGDDVTLRKPIFADFAAVLTHRICDGQDKEVAIQVVFKHTDDALSNALALGGEVTLEEDLLLTKSLKLNNTSGKPTIINLNGHTIKNVTTGTDGTVAAIYATKGTLIIRGEGTVDGGAGNGNATDGGNVPVYVGGDATVYIEGGNYKTGLGKDGVSSSPAVYVTENAHVFISGGKFDNSISDGKYLLNCHDASYANGTCGIEVTGGEYKNFNPQNNTSEGAGTSFVKTGYHAELAPYSLTDYVVVKD